MGILNFLFKPSKAGISPGPQMLPKKQTVQFDLFAGITVGLIVIPQAMAYAAIAGVNPIYGLYTAIIPTIIAALVGDYPYLATGPTNPTSLVVASTLIIFADKSDYAEYVFVLAAISGLIKILIGILKLGKAIRWVSNSVIIGFLSAVGILIFSGQIGNFLGISMPRGVGIVPTFVGLVTNLSGVNFYSIVVGLMAILIMIIVQHFNKRLAGAIIALVIGTIIVQLMGWQNEGVRLVRDVGIPSKTMISFHLPNVSIAHLPTLVLSALAVAVFGMVETISITKTMSQETGEQVDPSREMIGQGVASFVGGFFQCIPSSGSPSRTVSNVSCGAKTRLSMVFSGLTVFLTLILFSRWMFLIPMPVLAAVVILTSLKLIRPNIMRLTWVSRPISAFVMTATFFATLFLPLTIAIIIGIILSIVIYLYESHVTLSNLTFTEDFRVQEHNLEQIKSRLPEILVINVEGDLFFAAADELHDHVFDLLQPEVRVVILRLRRMHLLASTGVLALDKLIRECHDRGIRIMISGVTPEIDKPIEEAGLIERIGKENVFFSSETLFESTYRAYELAKQSITESS